jgi:hypothetical protein
MVNIINDGLTAKKKNHYRIKLKVRCLSHYKGKLCNSKDEMNEIATTFDEHMTATAA